MAAGRLIYSRMQGSAKPGRPVFAFCDVKAMTGLRKQGPGPMDAFEIARLQQYFRTKFGLGNLTVRGRPNKDDSAEVYFGDEFLGVIFRDDEDGDLCYQFNMAILDEDLPGRQG
jgi:hypothetical protein